MFRFGPIPVAFVQMENGGISRPSGFLIKRGYRYEYLSFQALDSVCSFAVYQCFGYRFHHKGIAGDIADNQCELCVEHVHALDHGTVDDHREHFVRFLRVALDAAQGSERGFAAFPLADTCLDLFRVVYRCGHEHALLGLLRRIT